MRVARGLDISSTRATPTCGAFHYAKFNAFFQVYCPAFYISVDHDKQTIILSIRGTLSLQVGGY